MYISVRVCVYVCMRVRIYLYLRAVAYIADVNDIHQHGVGVA